MRETAGNRSRRDDAALAKAAAQGDEGAFNQIFNLYCQTIVSLCGWMMGNFADGQDVAQEAWIQTYQKLGTYRGDSRLSTWLHRIAVNTALMYRRQSHLRYLHVGLDGIEVIKALTVESSVICCLRLDEAIGKIEPEYRAVILLHDYEGFEHGEIATRFGYSVNTSKNRLRNARRHLREIL